MKKYLVLFFIITIYGINCSAVDPVSDIAIRYASFKMRSDNKTRTGAIIMVQKTDNRVIKGEEPTFHKWLEPVY